MVPLSPNSSFFGEQASPFARAGRNQAIAGHPSDSAVNSKGTWSPTRLSEMSVAPVVYHGS